MSKGRRTVDPETGLTAQQEAFCVELVKTDNASDAYRKAYSTSNMKSETIANKAMLLNKKGEIRARVAILRAAIKKKSGITHEEHMKALGVLRNKAVEAKQYSAAITAEIARGKVSGLYSDGSGVDDESPVTRVEITVKDGRKTA